MTRIEAREAISEIRNALVTANKLNTSFEFEDALVLATRLIFYLRKLEKEIESLRFGREPLPLPKADDSF